MTDSFGWREVLGGTVATGAAAGRPPIGIQISGRPWREDVALALAAHLETIFGGCTMPSV